MRTLAAAAFCAAAMLASSAFGQDQNQKSGPPPTERRGPTSSADVLTPSVSPAPEDGNIVIRFGESTQIFFKRAIKSIRLEDGLLVKADPKSDHVIAFTGLAPGRTGIVIETADGRTDTYGIVTVAREPHQVRIYQPAAVNKQSGELRQDSTGNAGYYTIRCNEVGCADSEVAK